MERQTTEEILVEFGVHLGFGEQRKELARELEKGSLTGGDLRMVCDHVKDAGSAKTQGARISSVLKDKNRWGPLLADLRKFHEYRHQKEQRKTKRKVEPGMGLREQDKSRLADTTAEFFGLTEDEYKKFKWRWNVADWFNRGHDAASLETYMEATRAEVESCVEQFPKGQSFDEALANYTGRGKTDARTARPD